MIYGRSERERERAGAEEEGVQNSGERMEGEGGRRNECSSYSLDLDALPTTTTTTAPDDDEELLLLLQFAHIEEGENWEG